MRLLLLLVACAVVAGGCIEPEEAPPIGVFSGPSIRVANGEAATSLTCDSSRGVYHCLADDGLPVRVHSIRFAPCAGTYTIIYSTRWFPTPQPD